MPSLSISNKDLLSKRFKFNLNKFKNKNNKLLFSIKDEIHANNIFNKNNYKCIICNKKNFHIFSEIDRNLFPVNFSICESCGMINSDIHFSFNFKYIYYSKYYNQFKKHSYGDTGIFNQGEIALSFSRFTPKIIV